MIHLNIQKSSNYNTIQKYIQKHFIAYKIKQYNKDRILPLFTSEKNRKVLDELNRNMRVIHVSLGDYFSQNIMRRQLEDVIKE
jgi:hypothetical protein